MATGAREYQTRQVHYLYRDVTIADTSGTQYSMGKIPANAVVIGTTVGVTTVFNATTTNVLIVGTSGDDDALVAAAGVDETAVAVTRVAPATLAGRLSTTAEVEVFTKFTQSGTAATTGAAWVVVEYAVPDTSRN